jgi:hypothetical protein
MVLAAYKLLEQIVVESGLLEEYKCRYRSKPNTEDYINSALNILSGAL